MDPQVDETQYHESYDLFVFILTVSPLKSRTWDETLPIEKGRKQGGLVVRGQPALSCFAQRLLPKSVPGVPNQAKTLAGPGAQGIAPLLSNLEACRSGKSLRSSIWKQLLR